MTTIQAIETHYKGYRFRSRLEARWAVFYDTLGIRWEYESQGFELPSGRYLPDFWIPSQDCFIEIKGKEPNTKECCLANELCRIARKDVFIFFNDIPSPENIWGHFLNTQSSYAYFGKNTAMSLRSLDGVFCDILYDTLTDGTISDLYALDLKFGEFRDKINPKAYLTKNHLKRHLPASSFDDIKSQCNLIGIDDFRVYDINNSGGVDHPYVWTICPDCGETGIAFSGWSERICSCDGAYKNGYDHPRLIGAYTAARSARFEHGETPRVPRGKPRK